MFLRQISTYPFPSIFVSDFVSMSSFVIRIISTPSLSVQHDLNLWPLSPKVLFLQMCTPAALWTCVLQALQCLDHRICLWGCWTLKLSSSGSMLLPWQSLHLQSCACHSVCFSFSTQALWLPSKNWPLLPSSLHLLSHWLCHSGDERRGCHWSVSITGSSMGIQVWGPTRTFGKVTFLTKLQWQIQLNSTAGVKNRRCKVGICLYGRILEHTS